MRRHLFAVAASLCLTTATAAQPGPFDALAASSIIVNDLARQDLAGAADAASKLMEATTADKLKGTFRFVSDLGAAQYTDLVYARDYGRSEKDVIYKIDFAKAFLFVRFLYHVDNGAWRLINIHLKTEDELPLPREWTHIYPQ
jgi:hypothetical protein